jgi:hypothetical protein
MLTIKGDGAEEKDIYIQLESENPVKIENFRLTENSRTFILPKGDYTIGVKGSDKFSVYDARLGGLSKREISVKVKPQKKLKNLGSSSFDCTLERPSVFTKIFYPCSDYGGVFEVKKEGQLSQAFIDPAIEKLSVHSHGLLGAGDETNSTPTYDLLPYLSGVLSASSVDNNLSINHFGVSEEGAAVKLAGSTAINGFEGQLSNDSFAVINDTSGKKFAILDRTKKSVLVFRDASDKDPVRIDVSKELKDDKEEQAVRIAMSNDSIFLLVSYKTDRLEFDESHDFEPSEEHKDDELVVDQRLHILNIVEEKVVKSYKIPDDVLTFLKIAASPDGNLLMIPRSTNIRGGVHLVSAGKYEVLRMPQNDLKDMCWKEPGVFYYSIATGNQIYERSIPQQASFLSYSSSFNIVRGLNCINGGLYLSSDDSKDGSKDLVHYVLSEEIHSGARLEGLLPLYLDVGVDTLKVTQRDLVLVVEQIDDDDKNPSTPSKRTAEQKIIERLKGEGVNTEGLKLVFDY